MVIGKTARGESVRDLAARLYGVKAGSAAARAAEAALRDANPGLGKIDALPAGTPVVVPELPAATPAAGEVRPLDSAAAGALATQIEAVLSDVATALEGSIKDQLAYSSRVVEAMSTPEAEKFNLKQDPLVKAEVARAQSSAKDLEDAARQLPDLLKTIRGDLKELGAG